MTRPAHEVRSELLVLRAQDGDRDSFSEIVELHQPALYAHALQLTGQPAVAQDVLQETWVAVIRGLPRLRDPAGFAGFAHRVLVRRAADWTRARQRERRGKAAVERDVATTAAPTAPLRGVERAPDLARVRRAVDRLPPERRVPVVLFYFRELSIGEIAGILRIPSGTVKSRLHAARGELLRAMEGSSPCPTTSTS